MGFLGLIVSLVGAGVLAKDKFNDEMYQAENCHEARKNGKKTYYGLYGKEYSLKTGNLVSTSYGRKIIKRDTKTNQIVEDVTERKNKEREKKNKLEAERNGEFFYRTTKWDDEQHISWVYVCDAMPGKYFFPVRYHFIDCKYVYVEGKLVYDDFYGHNARKVSYEKNSKEYYPDGVERTQKEIEKRSEKKYKEKAIKNGDAFYKTTEALIYRKVDDDEYYKWNSDRYHNIYFTKIKKDGEIYEKVNGAVKYEMNGNIYKER